MSLIPSWHPKCREKYIILLDLLRVALEMLRCEGGMVAGERVKKRTRHGLAR